MEIQPQLILLQKTLFNIEGLGRHLYPYLLMAWNTASPILRDWMKERIGVRSLARSLRFWWPEIIDAARKYCQACWRMRFSVGRTDALRLPVSVPDVEV